MMTFDIHRRCFYLLLLVGGKFHCNSDWERDFGNGYHVFASVVLLRHCDIGWSKLR